MKSQVFDCPNCQQQFQVLPTQAGQVVQCPSCFTQVSIPLGGVRESADREDDYRLTDAPDFDSTKGDQLPIEIDQNSLDRTQLSAVKPEDVISADSPTMVNQPDPIDHLLPPRFDVPDPNRLRFKEKITNKVFLPDGAGGQRLIDQRVLHVEHGGEKIALVALTPQQKLSRRIVSNLIAIVIGIAVLAIVFWWLS